MNLCLRERQTAAFSHAAVVCLAMVIAGDRAQGQAARQTFDGTLIIVWGDPDPTVAATAGETRFELAMPDGRVARLQLNGQENIALQYFGKRVSITGQIAVGAIANANQVDIGTILVDSIAPGDIAFPLPPITNVTGTRRVIYLLMRFPEDAAVPHAPGFFLDLNNPDLPPPGSQTPATINGFFKKTSSNVFSWLGDVGGVGGLGAPGGWLTLPQPRSFYVPCGSGASCARLNDLANDATAAGRVQGIDFKAYDNINFVFSNDLDCCAWGGGYFSSVDGKSYGTTWEPPWGQNASTYAHEMGHSIGLPHSGWVYYSYDSPWDIMSAVQTINSIVCGSYLSANSGTTRSITCGEPADGFNASYKEFLAWIPPANVVTTDTQSSVTVALEGAALPLGSAVKMIKICLPAYPCTNNSSNARYFTVEARIKGLGTATQYDNGIPGEGVIIQEFRRDRPPISGPCFFNNQSGWALPIDATPADYDSAACIRQYPSYGLYNANFRPGQSYTSAYGVKISVGQVVGSTYLVSVTPTPPATASPSSPTIESGQPATVSVMAMDVLGIPPFSYQWYRGSTGTTMAPVIGATSTGYMTPPLTSSANYWARVWTANDVADSTTAPVIVAFTDNTLTAGVSVFKTAHVMELRSRIDALLVRFGRPTWAWTDPSLSSGTVIRAVHITELRGALAQAYLFGRLPARSYTDPSLLPGTPIKRAHIQELRDAVHILEAN